MKLSIKKACHLFQNQVNDWWKLKKQDLTGACSLINFLVKFYDDIVHILKVKPTAHHQNASQNVFYSYKEDTGVRKGTLRCLTRLNVLWTRSSPSDTDLLQIKSLQHWSSPDQVSPTLIFTSRLFCFLQWE